MIFLIGGPPRSGKTTLARNLSEEIHAPYISTDWLRSVVIPYIDQENEKRKFLEGLLFKKNFISNLKEEDILWPAIQSFVEDKSRWVDNFVIEGLHLTPYKVKLLTKGRSNRVKAIFLVKKNKTKILLGLKDVKKKKQDWLLRKYGRNKTKLEEVALVIANEGKSFEKEAKKYRYKVYNTEENFEKTLSDLVTKLSKLNVKNSKTRKR